MFRNTVSTTGIGSLPEIAWSVLRCPQCSGRLERSVLSVDCDGCVTKFPAPAGGSLDLRLQRPRTMRVDLEVGTQTVPDGFTFDPLRQNPRPQVDFSGIGALWHMNDALRSYFPKASGPDAIALDLGCGTGLHRGLVERAGFQWVGLDYAEPGAPLHGDAHALPFSDAAVEFVLSMAVLEHLRYPFVAAGEVARVLRPGGIYLGSVSFLEPFHGDSYYHHTRLGVYNTLSSAGFEVLHVSPQAQWSGLKAQAAMTLFPRMPAALQSAVVWPVETLSKLWWRLGAHFNPSATETKRLCESTGGFEFIARKRVA
jgi:SAM-dependent methyltransferase